jgi:hypothetical protein
MLSRAASLDVSVAIVFTAVAILAAYKRPFCLVFPKCRNSSTYSKQSVFLSATGRSSRAAAGHFLHTSIANAEFIYELREHKRHKARPAKRLIPIRLSSRKRKNCLHQLGNPKTSKHLQA